MIDLSNPKEVKMIQDSLKHLPLWHKDNMDLLEQLCGWYDFHERNPDMILMNHGKRQVLATLKTLLECTPEQVAQIVGDANDL